MIIYKVYKQFFKPTIYFILLSILKIIYPLIKIRFQEIETKNIGHYSKSIEIFLCEIKNKIHGKNNIYLAFRNKYIVNQFLYSKLKKNFIILPRIIMEPIF